MSTRPSPAVVTGGAKVTAASAVTGFRGANTMTAVAKVATTMVVTTVVAVAAVTMAGLMGLWALTGGTE